MVLECHDLEEKGVVEGRTEEVLCLQVKFLPGHIELWVRK